MRKEKTYHIKKTKKNIPAIVVGTFISLWIGLFVFSWLSDIYEVNLIKGEGRITKVDMRITSGNDKDTIVILTNTALLDSIDKAFKRAEEKGLFQGGTYETSAYIHVYKGNRKIEMFIEHSIYHGWMIDIGGKTLTSDYLFGLVKRYAKK